jgi:hypothetical protein
MQTRKDAHARFLIGVATLIGILLIPWPTRTWSAEPPSNGDLVITEILFDPPNELVGDSNRDGARHTTEDEFVELLNISDQPLDVGGIWITDSAVDPAGGKGAFKVPAGTELGPQQALILFGGGSPPGNIGDGKANPHFGMSLVFVSTGRIGNGLGNTEDTIRVFASDSTTALAEVPYSGSPAKDQSLTLPPNEIEGMVEHTVFAGAHPFSPGLDSDRAPFGGIAAPPVFEIAAVHETILSGSTYERAVSAFDPEGQNVQFRIEQLPASATLKVDETSGTTALVFTASEEDQGKTFNGLLVAADEDGLENSLPIEIFVAPAWVSSFCINEVLLDPGTDADANGDGTVDTQDDEFVEIVNRGSEPLDLSGLDLWDGLRLRHTFPSDSKIEPGQALLLFGGGDPAEIKVPQGVLSQVASSGSLSLNNSGETVTLRAPDGSVLITLNISRGKAGKGESLVRTPELEGEFAPSSEVASMACSPGYHSDGETPFSGEVASNELYRIRDIQRQNEQIVLKVVMEEFTPLKVYSCSNPDRWAAIPESLIERDYNETSRMLNIGLPLSGERAQFYGVGL